MKITQIEVIPLNGIIELPRTAGLGVELNEDVVRRLTVAAC